MSVLILDDEPEIVETLKRHFTLENIPSVATNSAAEALQLHEKHLFPVILTDIRMPEMSGMDFIKSVKKIHPTCIVYFMTGYGSMFNLVECLELGAADYFLKPFENVDSITKTIREALQRHDRWVKGMSDKKRGGPVC